MWLGVAPKFDVGMNSRFPMLPNVSNPKPQCSFVDVERDNRFGDKAWG